MSSCPCHNQCLDSSKDARSRFVRHVTESTPVTNMDWQRSQIETDNDTMRETRRNEPFRTASTPWSSFVPHVAVGTSGTGKRMIFLYSTGNTQTTFEEETQYEEDASSSSSSSSSLSWECGRPSGAVRTIRSGRAVRQSPPCGRVAACAARSPPPPAPASFPPPPQSSSSVPGSARRGNGRCAHRWRHRLGDQEFFWEHRGSHVTDRDCRSMRSGHSTNHQTPTTNHQQETSNKQQTTGNRQQQVVKLVRVFLKGWLATVEASLMHNQFRPQGSASHSSVVDTRT